MVPMIRKELRQRMRERRAWLLPTLYLLALGAAVALAYFEAANVNGGRRADVQGADIGEAVFGTVAFTQMAVLLLLAPAFSAGGLTIEKEQRTLSGLLTSLLSPPEIWWGKFVSSFLFLIVLQVSALPILSLSFALGGVSPGDVLSVSGITLVVLASVCSIALWCSSFFRRSVHATAASYGIVIVLSVLPVVAYGILDKAFSLDSGAMGGVWGWATQTLYPNPFFPLFAVFSDTPPFDHHLGFSLLLIAGMGCLAAGGAMRNIARGGEQV